MKVKSTAIVLFAMTFSAQVAHSQRAIAFDGIENARDMGTLVMPDGQTVRTGMLLRSGNLSKATDGDVAVLKEKYRLTDVFDFRFEAVDFIRAMVGVSRENFEAALDLIDQRYGSLSAYIENQLGFSREEQQLLRAKYLTAE